MVYPRLYTKYGDECVTRWYNRRGTEQKACTTESLRGDGGRKKPWCATATDRKKNPTAIGDCLYMSKASINYVLCLNLAFFSELQVEHELQTVQIV